MSYIDLDGHGFIRAERIVTIGRVDSAPMRRLLASLPRDRVVTMTGGRRRRSVILLDTGHAVVCAVALEDLHARLAAIEPGSPKEGR